MALLNWNKLPKPKDWEEDRKQNFMWKAKLFTKVNGGDPRVEIRKTFYWHNGKKNPDAKGYSSQCLIIVRLQPNDDPNILFSGNGKIPLSFSDFQDINVAIEEAIEKLSTIGQK